ncbi:hypothetical protein [Secundilactobacillus similis]|uniref:hypothetical protein n=1 Tax=Secundilactobacillus similis TaxID=414682 RepID=UPI0009EA04CA|nr:hypothetical protein [Secundilactobacillus similis]
MAYAITIPALVLFGLFVPAITPEKHTGREQGVVNDSSSEKSAKLNIGRYLLLIFVVITVYMIMGIKVPTLMVTAGYGTATDASYVILGLSLGAMLGGLIFGRVYELLKTAIFPVSMLILALAMGLIAVSSSTALTVLGGFITGVGIRMFFPWVLNTVNANGSGSALGTSLILVAYNLAGSLSPYSALAIQSVGHVASLRGLFWVIVGTFLILTVIGIITAITSSKIKQQIA